MPVRDDQQLTLYDYRTVCYHFCLDKYKMGLAQYTRTGRTNLLCAVDQTAAHGLLRELCCSLEWGTDKSFAQTKVSYNRCSLLLGQRGLPARSTSCTSLLCPTTPIIHSPDLSSCTFPSLPIVFSPILGGLSNEESSNFSWRLMHN